MCGIDRDVNIGFCGEKQIRISYTMLHHWEEPIISGEESDAGSGTIFFTGCNLKCVYCQNHEISRNGEGKRVNVDELICIIKDLENRGALNINFVTPTHFIDEIISALKLYKPKVPVVWNTSGYELPEKIEELIGLVDVFLTDFKYIDKELSKKYSKAENYFDYASKSILKMRKIVGDDIINNGIMKKGIIIRHMVLPSCTADSVKVLEWIKENLGNNTIISVMNQYIPCAEACNFPEINRRVKPLEYKRVVNKAVELGFTNIYAQDITSASTDYIPNFNTNKNDTSI